MVGDALKLGTSFSLNVATMPYKIPTVVRRYIGNENRERHFLEVIELEHQAETGELLFDNRIKVKRPSYDELPADVRIQHQKAIGKAEEALRDLSPRDGLSRAEKAIFILGGTLFGAVAVGVSSLALQAYGYYSISEAGHPEVFAIPVLANLCSLVCEIRRGFR